jgi:hypothetical protein
VLATKKKERNITGMKHTNMLSYVPLFLFILTVHHLHQTSTVAGYATNIQMRETITALD